MCYPGAYWVCQYSPAGPRRVVVSPVTPPPSAAVVEVARQQETVTTAEANGGSGGVGGGGMRRCVCSPTNHPGSFRCRHHHAEYEWVGRMGHRPS